MTDEAKADAPAPPKASCPACGAEPSPNEEVYVGPHYELVGKTKRYFGYSVTHPWHWPPMGGATHDSSPEWHGPLAKMPEQYRS